MTDRAFKEMLRGMTDTELSSIGAGYFQREGRKSFSSGRRLDIIYEECKRRSGGDNQPWLFLKIQGDNAENTAKRILARNTIRRFRKLNTMKKDDLISLLTRAAPDLELNTEQISKLNKQNIFALYGIGPNSIQCKAIGDSMYPTIMENDYLIADPDGKIETGNIILAKINNEIFVKRLSQVGDRMILLSDNPKYPQFEVSDDVSFAIQGKVVRVVRNTEM